MARVAHIWDLGGGPIVWTSTGDYLTFLTVPRPGDEPADLDIVAIDTHTGKQSSTHCRGCFDLTAAAGNDITALVSTQSLRPTSEAPTVSWVLDNAAQARHVRLTGFTIDSTGPHTTGTSSETRLRYLLAGTPSHLLGSYQTTSDGRVEYNSILTKPDGKGSWAAPPVAYRRFGDGQVAAVSMSLTPGHERILASQVPGSYGCAARASASLYGMDHSSRPTDLSRLTPSAMAEHNEWGSSMKDLWWGLDGNFHATMATWRCTEGDKNAYFAVDRDRSQQQVIMRNSLWTLDNSSLVWRPEPTPAAAQTRFIGNSGYLVLAKPDCIGPVTKAEAADKHYCERGVLYRRNSGTQVIIADRVLTMSTPPPVAK
ncbi:hypothetical protein FHY52_24760 [Nocardia nova]|uniref:hypothetical protein n=1 Tax=Nocardia nova TaxID=37330 RepID=UPI0025AFF042|nr:hypothetical protein [Nocardia nova]MDN2499862.1 hypothetical protein [Nocardia nova]